MITHRPCINIPQTNRLMIFIIVTVIMLFTLIINAYWMDPLYKQGVNMIHSAQTHLNWKALHIINNLFSMLCHPSTVGIVLFLELCVVKHKFKALIHISFFLFCIYFIAFLKQAYQQSRPIWSSKEIHKWEWFCPKDFGNPSGHSFALFPLYEPIISKYIGGFENFRVGWVLLIVFGFLVPFSRTYLGVHSVNQVMFGLTLGVAATVMYRYAIREWLYVLLSKIYKQKKFKHLVMLLIAHVICFIVPFLFFEIYSENKPMEKADVQNLNEFCLTSLSSYLIQESMLVKCTLESFIFGVMYGLYWLKYSKKSLLYFSGRWHYASRGSIAIHFLSTALICGLFAGIFIVLIPKLVHITFIDYLSNTVGMILIGFSLVYFLPKVEQACELILHYDEEELLAGKQLNKLEYQEKSNLSQQSGFMY